MAKLALYPFSMTTSCNTHMCYGRTAYIVARSDIDYGTAAATGARICEDCAKHLVGNIPSELLESADLDVEARIRAEERELVTKDLDEKYALEIHKSQSMFETLNAQFIEYKEQMESKDDEDDEDEDVPAFIENELETIEDETENNLFLCLDCNKEFGSQRALNGHKAAKHRQQSE